MSYGLFHKLCLVVPFLGFAAPTVAQDRPACPMDRVTPGAWAYTMTGTFILPSGPVPGAAVGSFVAGREGDVTGTQHFSLGGTVAKEIVTGTITGDEECNATMTLGIYDESGTLLRTAVWAVVWDDNGREARAILESLTLPSGIKIPTVVTSTARKVFANPVNGK
jgi:hypothetical protein